MTGLVGECAGGGRGGWDLPYDAVEGCNAEEVPFRGDPAPELVSYQQCLHRTGLCTHESGTIDLSPAFGFCE